MNILEAIATKRPFRRREIDSGWFRLFHLYGGSDEVRSSLCLFEIASKKLRPLWENDLVATDWEVQEQEITLTVREIEDRIRAVPISDDFVVRKIRDALLAPKERTP